MFHTSRVLGWGECRWHLPHRTFRCTSTRDNARTHLSLSFSPSIKDPKLFNKITLPNSSVWRKCGWGQPHTQYLFLFPIVFGINLIHFFNEKKEVQPEIRSFVSSLRSRVTPFDRSKTKKWELFRRVQRFWQLKVWTQRHSRGEKLRCNVWQGKVQNSSPILRCTFLARKSAKLIANFSAT